MTPHTTARPHRRTLAFCAVVVAGAATVGACSSSADSARVANTAVAVTTTTLDPGYVSAGEAVWLCAAELAGQVTGAIETSDLNSLATTYGMQSVVYDPAVALMQAAIQEMYAYGVDAAHELIFDRTAELCADAQFANHVNGTEPGDRWYFDAKYTAQVAALVAGTADAGDPQPNSPDPRSEPDTAADSQPDSPEPVPGSDTADEPSTTEPAGTGTAGLHVSATRIGDAVLGDDFEVAADRVGLAGERIGPIVLDECGNGNIGMAWDRTGVSLRGDSGGGAFAYTARAEEQTNTGLVAGHPIDLDGTGIGWGTPADEIFATFGDGSETDTGTQISVSDGVIHVYFDAENRLSAVQAGGGCSSGG